MFKCIKIKDFRGIKELELNDLKQINIFVGDNGVGKTSVLDAIYLLINPANPDLPFRTNKWRDLSPLTPSFWEAFFYNFDSSNPIELSAQEKNKRKLIIKPKISASEDRPEEESGTSEIEEEIQGLCIEFEDSKFENKKFNSWIQQKTERDAKLHPNLDYDSIITGHYFNSTTYRGGDDPAKHFDELNKKIGKDKIIEFLKKFKKEIVDIELDRFQKFLVKDTTLGPEKVHLNTYGDGLVRGLHYLLSFLSKPDEAITLIDEIDNGLHWSKQQIFWQSIQPVITDKNQQLFATTHSKEMIENLFRVAKKENFIEQIKVYRLQKVEDDIKPVSYQGEALEFAMKHDEEIR